MENKSKNTKIIFCVIMAVIVISVIVIVFLSMNKNKDKVGRNEMNNLNNQSQTFENNTQNSVHSETQNQTTKPLNSLENNSNVVIPTGSEQEEPPRTVSTPSNGQDNVSGGGHTE